MHEVYFAYGSNLDPGTFLGRRRMNPLRSEVARLRGYELVFDLPIGPGERAVANLRVVPTAEVVGVAYWIEPREGAWLDRTEGLPRGRYQRTAVELCCAQDPQVEGFTYVAPPGVPGRKPSARYMGLLLKGAAHHGLPGDWVERLRAFELAVDERASRG